MTNAIGLNLRRFRDKRGFTLKELSKRSSLKLSTLSAIEKGRIKSPSLQNLKVIAKALEIPHDLLLETPGETPSLFKGDLKGTLELKLNQDGLNLISYTPPLSELFIGKAVLKPKKTFDFKKFPNLSFVFIEVIFGKLEIKHETNLLLLTEGENCSIRSPQRKSIQNPFQTKETSFLIVSRPSLISAHLESQKPLA